LHAIRRTEIFARYHPRGTEWWVPYDPDHPDDRLPRHRPLLLFRDGEPVGTCRVDALPGGDAALRLVAVEPGHRGLGLGGLLVDAAERVAAGLGAEALCLNAQPQVIPFYARRGFARGAWQGSSLCRRSMPMRKVLQEGLPPPAIVPSQAAAFV
jgi:GNAT superfamily N-acetyltransferase